MEADARFGWATACERPSYADPLGSGAVLSDLTCAALALTHEASFFVQSCLPTRVGDVKG